MGHRESWISRTLNSGWPREKPLLEGYVIDEITRMREMEKPFFLLIHTRADAEVGRRTHGQVKRDLWEKAETDTEENHVMDRLVSEQDYRYDDKDIKWIEKWEKDYIADVSEGLNSLRRFITEDGTKIH